MRAYIYVIRLKGGKICHGVVTEDSKDMARRSLEARYGRNEEIRITNLEPRAIVQIFAR